LHRAFHAEILKLSEHDVPGYQSIGSALQAWLTKSSFGPARVRIIRNFLVGLEGNRLEATVYLKSGANWKTDDKCCLGLIEDGNAIPKIKQEILRKQLVPVKREPLAEIQEVKREAGISEAETLPGDIAGAVDQKLEVQPVASPVRRRITGKSLNFDDQSEAEAAATKNPPRPLSERLAGYERRVTSKLLTTQDIMEHV
jgi:hypothetical protein